MKKFRKDRMASLIRDLLSQMILRDVEVAGALITITEVEVTEKLDYAKVNISVIPSAKSDAALKVLKERAGEFQFELVRKMNVRPIPRISFEIDRGPEKAALIEKLLIEAEPKDGNETSS